MKIRCLLAPLVCLAFTVPAAAQFVDAAGQIPQGSPGNNSYSENVDFSDVDGDGDLDVATADGGDLGNDLNRLWINQGGLQGGTDGFFVDETATRFPTGIDTSRDIDFVDLDNDGDDDLYVSNTSAISNQGNRFWINQGGLQAGTPGFFVDETSTRWLNVGLNDGVTTFSSVPASAAINGGTFAGSFVDWSCDCVFGDLNNDGFNDLVHTTYGGVFAGKVPTRLFLNDGAGRFEEFNPSGFQLSGTNIAVGSAGLWCEGVQQHATADNTGMECDIADTPLGVELGDLDLDWDIDILHGARDETPRIFNNRFQETGDLAFRDVTAGYAPVATGGGNYEQELGDLDNDNDLDIYGVNWSLTTDVIALNNLAAGFGPPVLLAGSATDNNEPDFFDFDSDGDLDVFIAVFFGDNLLYENSGAPAYTFTDVSAANVPVGGFFEFSLGLDSCDVDRDGDYDLLVANDSGDPNKLLVNGNDIADVHAARVVGQQVTDRTPGPVRTVIRARVYENASWDVLRYNTVEIEYQVNGGVQLSAPMYYIGGQTFRGELRGELAGVISYQVKSTDEHGNVGLSPTMIFTARAPESYCTAGTSSSGCQALLSTSGTPSASATTGFNLLASAVEGAKDGVFYFGTAGRQANSWGNGTSFQCVVPPLKRARLLIGSGTPSACDGSFAQDLNALWCPTCPKPNSNPGAGAVVQAQLWYRDPQNTSNQTTALSNALEFVVGP